MKQILLVDADSSKHFCNLPLMKLSAFFKQSNAHVDLIRGIPTTPPLEQYDQVFISTVFFQNRQKVADYASMIPNAQIGGSGWNLTTTLPPNIEHIMPDYDLYPTPYSMGFTSRGCIRKCGFCIVPKKEGTIQDNAPITEFLHPQHTKLMLLDNNFLASPHFQTNLDFIRDHNLKANINSGLDARILTAHAAQQLATIKSYDNRFNRPAFHMAFDNMTDETAVRHAVTSLEQAGIKARTILIYVLTGYNTSRAQDLKRVDIIKEIGAIPYAMPYNKAASETDFTRWVNRRYYQFIPFDKYNRQH